jgi:hypothetical protein
MRLRAMTLRLRAPRELPVTVLASSAVAAGDLIAVAPAALVSATGPVRIEASRDAEIHMETTPTGISIPGTPNVVASPVQSMWQTDTVSLRLVMTASWGLRHSSGLAWLTTTAW